jgi:hypothetical protein
VSVAAAYRELAGWILAYELDLLNGEAAPAVAAERACQRFYERLRPLVTLAGSQAFMSRSLRLAGAEFPFLGSVRAGPSSEECLQGLDAALIDVEAAAATAGFVTVLAHMIGLLVTFIGHDLTMHAIRQAWPDARTQHLGEGDMA